jgi:hypothetical protein
MPTKLLIVCITVNAVLGQLLMKKALTSLGGRAALAVMPKFIVDSPCKDLGIFSGSSSSRARSSGSQPQAWAQASTS